MIQNKEEEEEEEAAETLIETREKQSIAASQWRVDQIAIYGAKSPGKSHRFICDNSRRKYFQFETNYNMKTLNTQRLFVCVIEDEAAREHHCFE